jgi:death-on-curing protein
MAVETLSADEVLLIHNRLVADFAASDDPISPPGLRNRHLLESAVARQDVSNGSILKYPSIHESAATLLYGLTSNHPFHNGNKRTALVSMLVHLDRNRHTLHGVRQAEIFQFMINVADHRLDGGGREARGRSARPRLSPDEEVASIARWIRNHLYRFQRGERQITFRQLRQILNSFGFDLVNPKGNSIDLIKRVEKTIGIFRPKKVVENKHLAGIGYPGETRFVPLGVLKKIRNICNLTEERGIDSAAFYDAEEEVDNFINDYRKALRRLGRN